MKKVFVVYYNEHISCVCDTREKALDKVNEKKELYEAAGWHVAFSSKITCWIRLLNEYNDEGLTIEIHVEEFEVE